MYPIFGGIKYFKKKKIQKQYRRETCKKIIRFEKRMTQADVKGFSNIRK